MAAETVAAAWVDTSWWWQARAVMVLISHGYAGIPCVDRFRRDVGQVQVSCWKEGVRITALLSAPDDQLEGCFWPRGIALEVGIRAISV